MNSISQNPSDWDIFSILDCKIPNPTLKQLKTAYLDRSKILHPDKNPDNPDAAQQFAQLSTAWSWISKETNYDDYIARIQHREKLEQMMGGKSSRNLDGGQNQTQVNGEKSQKEAQILKERALADTNRYIAKLREQHPPPPPPKPTKIPKPVSIGIDLVSDDDDGGKNGKIGGSDKKSSTTVNNTNNFQRFKQIIPSDPLYPEFPAKSSSFHSIFVTGDGFLKDINALYDAPRGADPQNDPNGVDSIEKTEHNNKNDLLNAPQEALLQQLNISASTYNTNPSEQNIAFAQSVQSGAKNIKLQEVVRNFDSFDQIVL
jgi:curved DNA-binding protein CbpA